MKIDMCVLGLLKFQSDEDVFLGEELDKIKDNIKDDLRQQQILAGQPQGSNDGLYAPSIPVVSKRLPRHFRSTYIRWRLHTTTIE